MHKKAETLLKMYEPEKIHDNFGHVIRKLVIKGMKGTNCEITFDFPITAISGFNGAGKSTIAQIALCAYNSSSDEKRKYLKDFFIKTLLDKQPYLKEASVDIDYAAKYEPKKLKQMSMFGDENDNENLKRVHVHYSTDRWAGYRQQPKRQVFYYGMSYFIPYQEQNSNLLRDSNANVVNTACFDKKIIDQVSNILSIEYTDLQNNSVSNDKREEEVISAKSVSAEYSENHMGCGEGRLLKLVDALENAPNMSLFVIEEPETALHQSAQHKLSEYFLDVCLRKRHQIIFTTHSTEVLSALPPQARKYIERQKNNTLVVNNATIALLNNRLSGGHYKGLTIVTEDKFAEQCLIEILRKFKHEMLEHCSVVGLDIGFAEIKEYVKNSRKCGFDVCGVLDENDKKSLSQYILAFPENMPPEKAILQDEAVIAFFKSEYGCDIEKLRGNHHTFFEKLSQNLNEKLEYIVSRSIKEYVKSKSPDYYSEIITNLSEWYAELK